LRESVSESRFAKSGAYGTGSWTDTSPRFGCCTASKVAVPELAANAAANICSLNMVPVRQSVVPVWELIEFVGRQITPIYLLFSQNKGVSNANATHQVHQHESH
jgi:hypothetical protein